MLLADRGYDADWIRALAAKKGAWANISPRRNRSDPICFSPYLCSRSELGRALLQQRPSYIAAPCVPSTEDDALALLQHYWPATLVYTKSIGFRERTLAASDSQV